MRFAQQSGTLFTFITKSIFVLLALHSEAIPPHTLASIPSITGTHHDYDNSDLSKKKKKIARQFCRCTKQWWLSAKQWQHHIMKWNVRYFYRLLYSKALQSRREFGCIINTVPEGAPRSEKKTWGRFLFIQFRWIN